MQEAQVFMWSLLEYLPNLYRIACFLMRLYHVLQWPWSLQSRCRFIFLNALEVSGLRVGPDLFGRTSPENRVEYFFRAGIRMSWVMGYSLHQPFIFLKISLINDQSVKEDKFILFLSTIRWQHPRESSSEFKQQLQALSYSSSVSSTLPGLDFTGELLP